MAEGEQPTAFKKAADAKKVFKSTAWTRTGGRSSSARSGARTATEVVALYLPGWDVEPITN